MTFSEGCQKDRRDHLAPLKCYYRQVLQSILKQSGPLYLSVRESELFNSLQQRVCFAEILFTRREEPEKKILYGNNQISKTLYQEPLELSLVYLNSINVENERDFNRISEYFSLSLHRYPNQKVSLKFTYGSLIRRYINFLK